MSRRAAGLCKAYTCQKDPTGIHAVMHSSAARPNVEVEITSDDISPDHDPHASRCYPMAIIGPPHCNPPDKRLAAPREISGVISFDSGEIKQRGEAAVVRNEEERAPQHGQFGHTRLLRATSGPCFSEESATDPTTSSTKNLRSPSQNSFQPDARPPLRLIINSPSV
jgi:hypothetical protein